MTSFLLDTHVAQARAEGMPLLTADRKVLQYGAGVIGV